VDRLISRPRHRQRHLRLRLRRMAVICIVVALPMTTATARGETLARRIDAHLAQPRFAAASWGITVVSLDDGHIVYQHDAGRLLLPASTAKLYTAAFALDRLGPAYRTHTDVLASVPVERGRLRGSLILRGRGDPTLAGSAWADALATQLRDQGLRRIDGGIVGDDTAFPGPPVGSGWEASDLQTAYGATASGLSIDENTMTADLGPAGDRVSPGDAAVALAAQAAPATDVYRAPGSATVFSLRRDGDTGVSHVRLSLPDPALTAARRLQSALERVGIRVDGLARSVHWPVPSPASAGVLGTVASPPLAEILRGGLKRSQNLYLQSVFLLLGLESANAQATRHDTGRTEDQAAAGLSSWLARHGIGPSAVMMEEGTGLSRHDLTTPASLLQVLVLMDASEQSAPWHDLLPVAGVDGTLARRMRGTAAEGNVQAKTGSMSLVNTEAGYVTTRAGQKLAFVVMLNNYRPPPRAVDVPATSADVDAVAVMLAEATGRL